MEEGPGMSESRAKGVVVTGGEEFKMTEEIDSTVTRVKGRGGQVVSEEAIVSVRPRHIESFVKHGVLEGGEGVSKACGG